MRGMDSKDLVMCHRNMIRAGIDLARTDLRRPHKILDKTGPSQILKFVKPVISVRGGDNRNMIQEARKKAQHNLANSVFTKFSVPTNNKIY